MNIPGRNINFAVHSNAPLSIFVSVSHHLFLTGSKQHPFSASWGCSAQDGHWKAMSPPQSQLSSLFHLVSSPSCWGGRESKQLDEHLANTHHRNTAKLLQVKRILCSFVASSGTTAFHGSSAGFQSSKHCAATQRFSQLLTSPLFDEDNAAGKAFGLNYGREIFLIPCLLFLPSFSF